MGPCRPALDLGRRAHQHQHKRDPDQRADGDDDRKYHAGFGASLGADRPTFTLAFGSGCAMPALTGLVGGAGLLSAAVGRYVCRTIIFLLPDRAAGCMVDTTPDRPADGAEERLFPVADPMRSHPT
jgi:hypothetical protein